MRSAATDYKCELILIFTAILGGTIYLISKIALQELTPATYLFYRFLIASSALFLFQPGVFARITLVEVKCGFVYGVFLGSGLYCSFEGLRSTDTGMTAFLVNVEFIFVPILESLLFRIQPTKKVILCILTGLIGVLLLTNASLLGVNRGCLWLVASSIWFSAVLMLGTRFAKVCDPYRMTFVAMTTMALLFGLLVVITGSFKFPSFNVILILLYAGLVVSALRFFAVLYAQKDVSSTKTGLLFLIEPVTATAIGFLVWNEAFSITQWCGVAILITTSVYSVFLRDKAREIAV